MALNFQSDVDRGFYFGMDTAIMVDGRAKNFAFADGQTATGRIPKRIVCLWLTEQYHEIHTRAKKLNTVVHDQCIRVLFRQCDTPCGAALHSNAYVDIDDVSYRIEDVVLECRIYQLTLALLGTD